MAKPFTAETYTASQTETALCVFEYLMDRAKAEPFADLFEGQGWAQMRLNAMETALWVEQVADGLEFKTAFDWEIIPWLMGRLDVEAWAEIAYGSENGFPAVAETRAALLLAFPDTTTA